MRVLVTGAAGFIGAALSRHLVARGESVLGLDNLNSYYDVRLKKARLATLQGNPQFEFRKIELSDAGEVNSAFADWKPQRVVNLAAQAGVRYSLTNPHSYVDSNVKGFLNILEACRHQGTEHLVYASSSSVYGANKKVPYSTHEGADHPVSLYGATKRMNELMAHSYSSLFGIPTTGLRFFSVYGPWGRPDMALFLFTKRIIEGLPIEVFNFGHHKRDFTYIDDIVEGVARVLDKPLGADDRWDSLHPDPASSSAPYRVYNIGNNAQVTLEDLITALEESLGMKAERNYLPAQLGDVGETLANVDDLVRDFHFRPRVNIVQGVKQFVAWYRECYLPLMKTRETRTMADADPSTSVEPSAI